MSEGQENKGHVNKGHPGQSGHLGQGGKRLFNCDGESDFLDVLLELPIYVLVNYTAFALTRLL